MDIESREKNKSLANSYFQYYNKYIHKHFRICKGKCYGKKAPNKLICKPFAKHGNP